MNIIVRAKSRTATTGTLEMNGKIYNCTLGRTGVIPAIDKREGDGKTPLGSFPLRQLIYRADRLNKPVTKLPIEVLTENTGWCEDPAHPDYNKKVTLPHGSVHDRMTRDDRLYDYTVVIGYNDDPVVPGRGSAIFLHLARPDFGPTAGCVGLTPEDMVEVLKNCGPDTRIEISLTS
jgi:L,D-peptidoglycan transpeptidase YkuD (ErfK/YbiS/YcfS/YnhG family)